MKRSDFENSPSGKLVPTERSQWAFVPNPLPPDELDLNALAMPLARASQAIGELNGIGRNLQDPYLLIRPLQQKEALTSSSMEGTYTTLSDMLLLDAGADEHNRALDTLEVLNYRYALSEAIESLNDVPLSLRTLRDAHHRLLLGVARHRGATVRAGELKIHQNFIGAYEIEKARFIPPPPDAARACLGDLETFIHRDDRGNLPDLIDAALIHYQFETIHPFADGNGRVGRMLIPLHLYARGVIRQPMLYLSPALEDRKDAYIDRMFEVSRSGDWIGWIAFFLDMVTEACKVAIGTADKLLALNARYRETLQTVGRSANLLRLADMLFVTPYVTIPRIADHLGVTYRAAQKNVDTLLREDILREFPGPTNPKFFVAHGVVDTISMP